MVGARAFVADVYTIESGSMLPTVRVGEHVLVRYSLPAHLERFDLVVFRPEGDGQPMVKRVAGLPGETILIDAGDLVIDGRKLAGDAARPDPTPLFDDRFHDPRQFFQLDLAPAGPWTVAGPRDPGGSRMDVDASGVRRGSDAGLAFFHKDVRDGYLEADGTRVPGLAQVGDAVVTTDFSVPRVSPEAGALRLRWRLVEAGDTFEVVLGEGRAVLVRRPGQDAPSDELDARPLDLEGTGEHRLRFANVDDQLEVWLDGERILAAAYGGNRPFLGVTSGGDRTSAPRVAFGAEGGRASFRNVRIGRDLHFTGAGTYGVERPLQLGLDELFLLGDNSTDSADSRYFGPVPLERVIGVPVAVTRPWARSRWLGKGRSAAGDGIGRDRSGIKITQDS
ncbi:Signal peptidase I T [Planctomycetes bacterium Pla86]|uniref:Signal peptidase I n=1 Tax=Engelhardtia mirabilis TaxID=2528011 RepID=A0A518BDD5_9BACT|nr:Signal peptidase I T [Planctomycetes bacterium Pla133]QDU99302.1 Signal peptidase I T [Planctomycetes bacterium Pla86]